MAKSRRRRQPKSIANNVPEFDVGDNDTDDGTLSTLSENTLMAEHHQNYPAAIGTYIHAIREHAQLLADRRSSVRCAACNSLWRILTKMYVPYEALDGLVETIVDGLLRGGIKKGAKLEAKNACRALATLWITIADGPSFKGWERAREVLLTVSTGPAMECLAMGCFLFEEEPEDEDRVLNVFAGIIVSREKGQDDKLAECLKGWLLIATSFDLSQVLKRIVKHGNQLGRALVRLASGDSGDSNVRIAAAEVLAYIAERSESLDEDLGGVGATSAIDMIAGVLKGIELKEENHHARVSKSDRHWRKQLLQFAATNANSNQTVKAGQAVLQASGVADVRRLLAFRSVLGGGLPVHVCNNPLLMQIFDISSTALESRGDRKINAGLQAAARKNRRRERNVQLTKKRQSRWAQMEILTVGESD
eukprot:Plantae.Rhodophyta-Hildenbrandia_rubra.ctg10174.p1 GENE.Plantae.Rhodophyta-Hildenbrandia_rubra.ctg10174~~Plantae.Rhodophyta-Hildenbrandia_rubra.ctg10174.p1  ORF type:complete len:420 (+),score=74.95 Plantae.Rhodophyta-Hildenbrandia_rubra.ctg10174:2268-3527(+)